MKYIRTIEEGFPLFKALGSEIRIRIMKLLLENQELSMNEMAAQLDITNGALTSHVRMLEECGLIRIDQEKGLHGNRKICRIAENRLLFDIVSEASMPKQEIYSSQVPIGHYSDYQILPTCGIATVDHLIGEVDDPRYFAQPDRINAGILWFTRGYVEYIIPNLLPDDTKIDQITLSFEIGSEAPGISSNWPSDITFMLNDEKIGVWTSLGDFGDVRGIFTPEWWLPNWNQYGVLKLLTINKEGTFIDGLKISEKNIEEFQLDYKSTIRFKFAIADDARNIGGFTLFGSGFGNYNQDIRVRISYSPFTNPKVDF